jgi:hypothetical protein
MEALEGHFRALGTYDNSLEKDVAIISTALYSYEVLIIIEKVLIRNVIFAINDKPLYRNAFRLQSPRKPLFHVGYRPIQTGKQQTIWGRNGMPRA